MRLDRAECTIEQQRREERRGTNEDEDAWLVAQRCMRRCARVAAAIRTLRGGVNEWSRPSCAVRESASSIHIVICGCTDSNEGPVR